MTRRFPTPGAVGSDPGLAERVEEELAAQGLTAVVVDVTALRRVAGLLGAADPNVRQRRLADARRELAGVEVRVPLLEDPSPGAGEE